MILVRLTELPGLNNPAHLGNLVKIPVQDYSSNLFKNSYNEK